MTLNRKPTGVIRPSTLTTAPRGVGSNQPALSSPQSASPMVSHRSLKVSTPNLRNGNRSSKATPVQSPASTPGTPPHVASPTTPGKSVISSDGLHRGVMEKPRRSSAGQAKSPVAAKVMSPATRQTSCVASVVRSADDPLTNVKTATTHNLTKTVSVQKRKTSNVLANKKKVRKSSNSGKGLGADQIYSECTNIGDMSANVIENIEIPSVTLNKDKNIEKIDKGDQRTQKTNWPSPSMNKTEAKRGDQVKLKNLKNQTKRSQTCHSDPRPNIHETNSTNGRNGNCKTLEANPSGCSADVEGVPNDFSEEQNSILTNTKSPHFDSIQAIVNDHFGADDDDDLPILFSPENGICLSENALKADKVSTVDGESQMDDLELAWDFDKSQFVMQLSQPDITEPIEFESVEELNVVSPDEFVCFPNDKLLNGRAFADDGDSVLLSPSPVDGVGYVHVDRSGNVSVLDGTVESVETEDCLSLDLKCSDITLSSAINSLLGKDSPSLILPPGLEKSFENAGSSGLISSEKAQDPGLGFLLGQEKTALNSSEGQEMSQTTVTGREAPVTSALAEPSTKHRERDSAIALHLSPDIVNSSRTPQTERSKLQEVHADKIRDEFTCLVMNAEGGVESDIAPVSSNSSVKNGVSENLKSDGYFGSNLSDMTVVISELKTNASVANDVNKGNNLELEETVVGELSEPKEANLLPVGESISVTDLVHECTPTAACAENELNAPSEMGLEKENCSENVTLHSLENSGSRQCTAVAGEEKRLQNICDSLSSSHREQGFNSTELLHSEKNSSVNDSKGSISFKSSGKGDSSDDALNLKSIEESERVSCASEILRGSLADVSRATCGQLVERVEGGGLSTSHSRLSLGDAEQVPKDDQCEGGSADVTLHCNSGGALQNDGTDGKSSIDNWSEASPVNLTINHCNGHLDDGNKAGIDVNAENLNIKPTYITGVLEKRFSRSCDGSKRQEGGFFEQAKDAFAWKSASYTKFFPHDKCISAARSDFSIVKNEDFSQSSAMRSRPYSVEDIYSASQFHSSSVICQEHEPLSLPPNIGFLLESFEVKCAKSTDENKHECEGNEVMTSEVQENALKKLKNSPLIKNTQKMPKQLSYSRPSLTNTKAIKRPYNKSLSKSQCIKPTVPVKKVSSSAKTGTTRESGASIRNSLHLSKISNCSSTSVLNSVFVASDKTGRQDKPSIRQVKRKLTATDCSDKKRSAIQSKTIRSKGSTVSNSGRRGSEVVSNAPPADASPATKGPSALAGGPPAGGGRPTPRTSVSSGDKSAVSASRRSDALKPGQAVATRRPGVASRAADPVKTARGTRGGPTVAPDTAELKRLEAALSAKSSEVEEAKREAQEARNEACEAGKGLQALTVLVHHLTKQYEAFSNPLLKTEIARLQRCLQEAEQALGESRNALEAAETRLSEEQASAALQQQQLRDDHETSVTLLRQQHQQQLQDLSEQQRLQLEELNKEHESDTDANREKHQQEIERLQAEHERKMASLVREHEEKLLALNDEVSRLKKLQNNGLCHDARISSQVTELTAVHAEREQELQMQSLSLQKEGEKLKERNKKLHESLLSDTDHRLVGIRQHCSDLQKEVDSLKSVVEMRNCELHKLRAQVLTMEQLERDLEAARHLAKTLQAKTEDLNAQMNTKAQTERQLMQSNLQLKETMDRESSANKQLRLENEQLQWKLRQREQLSHSLPPASLDGMSRISHLNTSWQERPASLHHQHVFRDEQQSSLSRSGSVREEKGPLTSSPVHASFGGKRESIKCGAKDSYDEHSRMRGNFDGLSPPSSPCVKAVIEKSNSVSFVLDLNDSLSDESYLDFPASPRMKHATPVLSRKGIQKSRSSSLEKKQGTKVGRSNSLSKCTSAGNFFSRLHPKEVKPKFQKLSTDSDGDQHMQSDGSVVREHTTSESSCGAESVERVSPHGMSWTVPVDDCSSNSPRSPKLDSTRACFSSLRHLHQPEEDEYEENLEENEDGFIPGITSDLTPLVNLMNASSSSPSDSELSRCGSQAGLTSESEEESSLAESSDRVGDSLSPVAEWVTTVGAGEAMVPSELVSNCCESESTDSSDQIVTKDSIPTRLTANELASEETKLKDPPPNCTVATGSANEKSRKQN